MLCERWWGVVGSDGRVLGAMENVIWCYRSEEKHVQLQYVESGNAGVVALVFRHSSFELANPLRKDFQSFLLLLSL